MKCDSLADTPQLKTLLNDGNIFFRAQHVIDKDPSISVCAQCACKEVTQSVKSLLVLH